MSYFFDIMKRGGDILLKEKIYRSDYRALAQTSSLLEIYYQDQQADGLLETFHWHYEPEVILCTHGSLEVYCNGKTFHLKANDLMFINSSQLHSLNFHPYTAATTFCFNLNALISGSTDQCDQNFLLPLKNLDQLIQADIINSEKASGGYAQLLEIVRHIVELDTERPSAYQLELKSSLFRLLFLLLQEFPLLPYKDYQPDNTVKNYDRLKDVVLYMNRHYPDPICIQDLASIMHLSTSYFCKYFKKYIGNSPMDYLNIVRTENAAKLLKTTNNRIIDIAYEVGFQNFSYFSRTFLRYKGTTPSGYRRQFALQSDYDQRSANSNNK